MRAVFIASILLWLLPGVASAQDASPLAAPAPPGEPAVEPFVSDADAFAPADPEMSDAEIIRWAARDVARSEGRAPAHRPPVPPDAYLGHSRVEGDVVLAGEEARDGVRLLAELGGGALGVLVGGGAGTLLIWAAVEGRANPNWMIVAVGTGTVVGALGVSAGVTLAADLTGGRGNFGHAFLGQTVGSALALPLVVFGLEEGAPAAALVAAGLLPLAGAILGYEIGHASSSGGTTTLPVAYVTPVDGGAVAAVAGSLW